MAQKRAVAAVQTFDCFDLAGCDHGFLRWRGDGGVARAEDVGRRDVGVGRVAGAVVEGVVGVGLQEGCPVGGVGGGEVVVEDFGGAGRVEDIALYLSAALFIS